LYTYVTVYGMVIATGEVIDSVASTVPVLPEKLRLLIVSVPPPGLRQC
jgi:hypothetical protein